MLCLIFNKMFGQISQDTLWIGRRKAETGVLATVLPKDDWWMD